MAQNGSIQEHGRLQHSSTREGTGNQASRNLPFLYGTKQEIAEGGTKKIVKNMGKRASFS